MFVSFTKGMMNILFSYLNKKYMERSVKHGRGYSVRKFADEVGIKEGTMLRLLDESTDVKGMEIENLQKLTQHFGEEILRVLGFWPGSG